MDRKFTIFCGGLAPEGKAKAGQVLFLNLWGGSDDDNLVLRIEDIHRPLLRDLPPQFHDLAELSAYIYCADQMIRRTSQDVDSFGGQWRRDLHFRIPVRCPEIWQRQEVSECLVSLLNFLSDDHYSFSFHKAISAPAFQQYLGFADDSSASTRPEGVVMFSGGIDSLAGLIDETMNQKRRIVAVTHKSTSKNNAILRILNQKIAERSGNYAPVHMGIRAHKRKSEAAEYTQRTRSFLFASIGATIARMLGTDHLRFYENGVVSLNLPICTQVVGGRATRTTHPRVIKGFQNLFSLLGDSRFTVENPYLWKTKAEVIEVILRHGHGDLIDSSISCAHTWERTKECTHCGTCSQCIDRRIAVVAAGAEAFDSESHYKNDVFAGARPRDDDKIMLASFLERAFEVERLSSATAFVARYPMVLRAIESVDGIPGAVAERMLALYKRHAREVQAAVQKVITKHSEGLMLRRLPPECLVRIVTESNSPTSLPVVGSGEDRPRNYFWERGNVWEARFNNARPILIQSHRKGCAYLQSLLSRPFSNRSVFELIAEDLVDSLESHAKLDASELESGFQITQGLQRGNLGDVADPKALESYKRAILELAEDLREARANQDTGKVEMLEMELVRIEQALSEGADRQGKPRKSKDGRKNLRDAFRNSVNRTIAEIESHDSSLGKHLRDFVKLGAIVDYIPEGQFSWSTHQLFATEM